MFDFLNSTVRWCTGMALIFSGWVCQPPTRLRVKFIVIIHGGLEWAANNERFKDVIRITLWLHRLHWKSLFDLFCSSSLLVVSTCQFPMISTVKTHPCPVHFRPGGRALFHVAGHRGLLPQRRRPRQRIY